MRGRGIFAGAHEVAIGGRNYRTDRIVIATGSKSARPPIPDAQWEITGDEPMHSLEQPRKLIVVGWGFIRLEFGFALAWAGLKVEIFKFAAAGMRGGLRKSRVEEMHYVFPTLGRAIFDTMTL